MTNAGRVALTKSTMSAMPVHVSIACSLSSGAIDQIDKRRRAFIWTGNATCTGAKCRVAWPTVCRPTELGGLGVIDLRFFGLALRLRWEWLARTDPQRSWVSLPSKREPRVASMCAASLRVAVGDGASARLWTDNWRTDGPLCDTAPALFAALSRPGKKRSLRDGLHNFQ